MCIVEGCDRPAVAKGLCDKHYQQLRRNGYIKDVKRNDICKIPNCGKPVHAQGFCQNHYNQYKRGKIDADGRRLKN